MWREFVLGASAAAAFGGAARALGVEFPATLRAAADEVGE